MSELPSTSTTTPPPAAVTNTGRTWLRPRATLRLRRSNSSRDRGPGISVTRLRICGRDGPPVMFWLIPADNSRRAGSLGAAAAPGEPAGRALLRSLALLR